ncbi:MAG: hypothetical protein ACTIDN_09735 [Acetobacter sp.]|uniref:hypothetical protein n=1 Tax=Acetobacter sp. TaxID=440 RepID=UPI003F8F3611
MPGTLYTRPTLRQRAEDAIVLLAAIAGWIWNAAARNPFLQALFWFGVYSALAAALMFTETGNAVTGDLLAMLMAFGAVFADLGSAFL